MLQLACLALHARGCLQSVGYRQPASSSPTDEDLDDSDEDLDNHHDHTDHLTIHDEDPSNSSQDVTDNDDDLTDPEGPNAITVVPHELEEHEEERVNENGDIGIIRHPPLAIVDDKDA